MCPDENGAQRQVPIDSGLNVYALVIYVPDPLGRFLDDLRRELVPHYNPHAHVSVLPPRSLSVEWRAASEQVRSLLEAWPPFEIELTRVDIFPVTKVIYLELGRGAMEMYGMHAAMNSRCLSFREPYQYHPHVTLAQEIPDGRVDEMRETAIRRWHEYTGPRRFLAERAVFVQNTVNNHWVDLAEYALGAAELSQPRK